MAEGDQGFFERVYEVVRQVPYCRVTSYGAIERFLGTGGSARMVGWAMNNAHSLDELRISAVARTQEEIKATITAGRVVQDCHTLLLDRFEELREVGGKSGHAAKFIRPPVK